MAATAQHHGKVLDWVHALLQGRQKVHTSAVIRLISLLLLITVSEPITALYRWQDSNGQIHYSDTLPQHIPAKRVQQLGTNQPRYRVLKVLDGDTLLIRGGDKVRLLGINTPEIAHRKQRAEPLGNEAKKRLQSLLRGGEVLLEFDRQRHDKYRRLLAHVTLPDGRNVNEILLQEGLARALFLQPNMKHLQRYFHAEAKAIKEQRGIWSRAEYRIHPASEIKHCIKRFCRLRATVRGLKKKRNYVYLLFDHNLRAAIRREDLPQFNKAGLNMDVLSGKKLMLRGWIGTRDGEPQLKLEHPLQITLITDR